MSNVKQDTNDQKTTIDLDQQIELLQKQIKNLKQVQKLAKKPNGQKVKFVNKQGETVLGYGTLYYYGTLENGEKFCKKQSDCTIVE